jgi:electron transport complex protein RnfA
MADAKVLNNNQILVEGLLPTDPESVRLVRADDADILLEVTAVSPGSEPGTFLVTTTETLQTADHYLMTLAGSDLMWSIAPSAMAVLVAGVIGSALINNMVFTRYLGLCVFFGVSRKKETAIGMGVTFTIVGLLSGMLTWALNEFVMRPKKVNKVLHGKFGIYLMLITTNCIILAVPLLNATNEANLVEGFALALGSGLGFALALFLFSCARERVDMAPVPVVFRGLPIAFIVAGLFALAFLGFSGLSFL